MEQIVFVHALFRGTLIGPFAYGHFGMSDYQLTVDSVLFARLPSRNDCGK